MAMTMLRLDYQRNLSPHWAGLALLALALAALTMSVSYYLELNAKVASWEEKLALVDRGHGLQTAGRSGDREELAQEVERANEVLRQLTLPWEQLFRTVESAAGTEIALLALEPDVEKHVVKISGEAKDLAALLNYITRLEDEKVFGPVYLQNHHIQQQDPEKPVRFALLAAWRGTP